MSAWDKIVSTHVIVGEKQLLQLFRICKFDNCKERINQNTLKIETEGRLVRVIYECFGGHCGEWTSEPTKQMTNHCYQAITCRVPVDKTLDLCSQCDDQHILCFKSLAADPDAFTHFVGIQPNVFGCILKDFVENWPGLSATLLKFIKNRLESHFVNVPLPPLYVSRTLLAALVNVRGNMPADLLAHCMFGSSTDRNHERSVSFYAKFVALASGFWIQFLSDRAIELRDGWLAMGRLAEDYEGFIVGGKTECFEIQLSSLFRQSITMVSDALPSSRLPRLFFVVLFGASTANHNAIVDWSTPTITYKDDQDFVSSVVRDRGWRILNGQQDTRDSDQWVRRKRLQGFMKLFSLCIDWTDVTEATLKLNVCCLLANLMIDDVSQNDEVDNF